MKNLGKSTLISAVAVAICSTACSVVRTSVTPDILVRLAGVANSDSSYVLSLVVYDSTQRMTPQRAYAVVDRDTLAFSLAGSGAPNRVATLSYTAGVERTSREVVEKGALRALLVVETSAGIWSDTMDVPLTYATSLALEPFVVPHPDGVELGCMAHRLLPRPDEFLPSSEAFRLIIRDRNGQVVYRSDEGMAFLQVITPVEPRTVGEHQRFSFIWRGTSSSGQTVAHGTYSAEMTIPAVPFPYTATVEITWPQQ